MDAPSHAGRARCAALDAQAGLGSPGADPALAAWAAEALGARALIGLAVTGLPADWRDALADAGTPLSATGPLSWADVRHDPAAVQPILKDGRLTLPPLPVFTRLTSLPLRDLRAWVAQGTGVRLRLATGVRLYLAADRAVLVNIHGEARSGFLHGPNYGMRAGVDLGPGEAQVLTW